MSVILYLAGLIIGIALFVYMLSMYESGKEKVRKVKGGSSPKPAIAPENITIDKIPPGTRMCPLCRSHLTKYEALYASNIDNGDGRKIMIHGCRYCYKPDEDPDKVRKSAI